MTSPTQILKSIGPKLVPFFKSVAVYFVLFIPTEKPSVWGMFVKCAPILSLMFFVLLHGMSFGDEHIFSRRIFMGLVFSCGGDALLIWPQYFLHGMASFGIAQIFYTLAFGFQTMNITLGITLYSICAYAVSLLIQNTTGVFTVGVPIYSLMLITMVWRAMARVRLGKGEWAWTEICSCVGGIFFVLSDAVIGFDRFYSPIPHSQMLIMTTYYIAQIGIALSVVDSSSTYKLAQQKLLEKNAAKEKSQSDQVVTKSSLDVPLSSKHTASKKSVSKVSTVINTKND